MFRLTIKNLLANKVRFALTTFGVMLAVSFVVSAFVLGDGLRSSFTNVSEEVTAGVDLEVRNVADFGDAPPLPPDTVATVAAVDGVADAVASIEAADNAVRPITANGDSIPTDGPPQLAFNWIDNAQLSPFTLVDGAPPQVGEFTMDVDSAAKYGFVIGDTYERHGARRPGRPDAVGHVVVRCRQLDARRRADADEHRPGERAVRHRRHQQRRRAGRRRCRCRRRPGRGRRRRCRRPRSSTTRPCSQRRPSEFTDEIDIVGNILLGFGGVALFVSIFIIYNTFAIVLGQRTRELALLRTVGADPKQIRRSVLGEALVMGVLASVGGHRRRHRRRQGHRCAVRR